MPDDAFTRDETHEVVSTLKVAGGAKADSANGALGHGIVMFFVSLGVGSKLEPNMFVIIDLTTK